MKKFVPFNEGIQEGLKKNFAELIQEAKKNIKNSKPLSEKEKEEWIKSL